MGAFNVVFVNWVDPGSGRTLELDVQFKYGATRQHEYRVGDVLRWGHNEIGRQDAKRVVVDGCVDAERLGVPVPEDWEVHIRDGRIEKVVPAAGEFDFVNAEESFIVLE